MSNTISLCRVFGGLRRNRAILIQLAFETKSDVRAFWESPRGDQRLYRLSCFRADPERVLLAFLQRNLRRFIYEPHCDRLTLVATPDEEAAVSWLLADLTEIAEQTFKVEDWSVQEEHLDPMDYELYLVDAEEAPDGEAEGELSKGWGFLISWSPERSKAVLKAREELGESLQLLTGIWSKKTGRPVTREDMVAQHRILADAGYPAVVTEVPDGARFEDCKIYRAEGEPDLVVESYLLDGGSAPSRRILHPVLGHFAS